jgi:quinoprotein glucose dehydrogenase
MRKFALIVCLGSAVLNAQYPTARPAWTFHTKAIPPNQRSADIAAFEATPVLAGDSLIVITPFDQVIALDPASGAEKWRFDPHLPDRDYSEASARGVAVAGGIIYFGTLDARLVALHASDGKLLWNIEIAPGVIDGNYQLTSPPVVVRNTVIVGSSIGDNSRAEMEHGTVRGFDARNGRLKWSWDPTPAGKTGAANAWAPLTADASNDLLLVPTGSASPDFFGGLRPGDNLYANAVVALRASTGERLWNFQVVHHDLWDYDVASSPLLVNWNGRPAVGVLTKMGHSFVLDRETGKPLLPVSERPVPKSDVAGESAWPTQPFPESGLFTEQTFRPRPGWCEAEFKKLRYEGVFTPPSLGGSLEFPGNVGGANWGGGVYDSTRGLIFVAANRMATTVRLIPRETFDRDGHGDTGERIGQEYARQAGTPYGMVRRTFLDEQHLPCNQPPWGALVAIDVATGKLRWETPTTVSLGGPLEVEGLVLFSGDVFAKKLRAYAADDGRKVWEADLPHVSNSVPGTYTWKGKRYVVVCAGGHGKLNNHDVGDDVVAFTLE